MIIQTLRVKDPEMIEKFFIEVLGFQPDYEAGFVFKNDFAFKFKKGRLGSKAQWADFALTLHEKTQEMIQKIQFFSYRTSFPIKIKNPKANNSDGFEVIFDKSMSLKILTN